MAAFFAWKDAGIRDAGAGVFRLGGCQPALRIGTEAS